MAAMNLRERELVEKHLYLVRGAVLGTVSINETIQGLGFDDLYQIGCEALCHAAQKYRTDGGAAFPTFAGIVIKNRLLSHCRKTTKMQKPLEYMDAPQAAGSELTFAETFPDQDYHALSDADIFIFLDEAKNAAPAPQGRASKRWRSSAGDIPAWRLPHATAPRQTMWPRGSPKLQKCCGKKN